LRWVRFEAAGLVAIYDSRIDTSSLRKGDFFDLTHVHRFRRFSTAAKSSSAGGYLALFSLLIW
jgi:hypothetical protein